MITNDTTKKLWFLLLITSFLFLLSASPPLSAQVERRNDIVRVVEKAGPAIVNISTEQKLENPFYGSFMESLLRDFFHGVPESEYEPNSLGSGVIIDGRGYILTNEHVILGASRIRVSLADKRDFFAEVAGTDLSSDLAVLKIDSNDPLPTVKLGNSSDIMIGETIIAIGNPYGFSSTVTTGVVSALRRKLKGRDSERTYNDFIQIDAAINPGNSGGALLNIEGELIGINTAIISQAEGIGFAIPIDRAKKVFNEIVSYGEVRPLWTGIDVTTLDPELKRYLKTPEDRGAVVTNVYAGSPAEKAGIRAGDIVSSIGNKEIESREDFNTVMSSFNIGDRIQFAIKGKGGPKTVSLTIADFPYDRVSHEKLGIEVSEASSGVLSIITGSRSKGVVISMVKRNGAADRRGLATGDRIIQINNTFIENINDYNKLLPTLASKRSIFMVIIRGRYSYRLTMELD